MANVYVRKKEEKAISIAIDVLQAYLNQGVEDFSADNALNELINLKNKIENQRVKN